MVKIIENYVLNESIGEGNFGSVYRATNKTKPGNFAVKVIPIQKFQENDKLETYISNQIQALSTIGVSDYIIRYYEVIKSKNNYYIVYEFCDGGTLQDLLRKESKLEETNALSIFRQLLEAFKVLNKNNIMHRDLKPENIFFTSESANRKVKLGDFGFCKGLKPDENLAKTMLGSPIYMAPEVLKGESYTTKADVWSLGVILYEMVYGFCPFQSKSIASLISTIDSKQVQFPAETNVTQKTQNLIKKMLTKDYFRRMGWVELFGYKINQNGEYMDDKGGEESKKVYSSLFGSMSLPVQMPISQNSRSYSMVKDREEEHQDKTKQNPISLKKIVDAGMSTAVTSKHIEIQRTSSQPKEKRKFQSQKYMKIFASPLSLESKLSKNLKREDEVIEDPTSNFSDRIQPKKEQDYQAPLSPQYRHERLTSLSNLDTDTGREINTFEHASSYDYPTFNSSYKTDNYKYLEDRNNEPVKTEPNEDKRAQLLKKHGNIEKLLKEILSRLESNWLSYRKDEGNKTKVGQQLKYLLEDSYILLRHIQEKLKEITYNIKITETSLLDMASLVNYEQIQVDRFIVELKGELVNWGCRDALFLSSQVSKNQNGTPNLDRLLQSELKNIARQCW